MENEINEQPAHNQQPIDRTLDFAMINMEKDLAVLEFQKRIAVLTKTNAELKSIVDALQKKISEITKEETGLDQQNESE